MDVELTSRNIAEELLEVFVGEKIHIVARGPIFADEAQKGIESGFGK